MNKPHLQRISDYLVHVVQAIERIEKYTEDMDEISFLNNSLVQDAVVRNIEIIGEASHNIEKHYPDFADAHQQLPLSFACMHKCSKCSPRCARKDHNPPPTCPASA